MMIFLESCKFQFNHGLSFHISSQASFIKPDRLRGTGELQEPLWIHSREYAGLATVFACLMMEEGASEHLKQDNEYFQKVCGPTAGFGARVIVPMSSQGEWRQGKLGWSGLSSVCFLTNGLIHDQ